MIVLGNVTVHAGPFGLGGISLEIPRGHCAVLLGRTACGTTTLLETLCGRKPARADCIFRIDDGAVTRVSGFPNA